MVELTVSLSCILSNLDLDVKITMRYQVHCLYEVYLYQDYNIHILRFLFYGGVTAYFTNLFSNYYLTRL